MTFPLPPNEALILAELIRLLDARVLPEEDRMSKDNTFFDANLVPVGVVDDELHGLERLKAAQEAHAEDLRLWDDIEVADEAAAAA